MISYESGLRIFQSVKVYQCFNQKNSDTVAVKLSDHGLIRVGSVTELQSQATEEESKKTSL